MLLPYTPASVMGSNEMNDHLYKKDCRRTCVSNTPDPTLKQLGYILAPKLGF